MTNLKDINGNEIIDYLNNLSDDDHEEKQISYLMPGYNSHV